MKQSNLKISSQINLWIIALVMVIAGFVVSTFFSMDMLWLNTKNLYEHPLTVRRAVGEIEVDVLYIHNKLLHLVNDEHSVDASMLIADIDALETDIYRQMDILYDRYLGPKSDLDSISDSFAQWNTIRNETIRLYQTGELSSAQHRVEDSGIDGVQATQVMNNLNQVSNFARNKGDEFYNGAVSARQANLLRTSLLSIAVILIAVIASYLLRRGILPPLTELTKAADEVRNGKLDSRVRFHSKNELGLLSGSFNSMASTIQTEMTYRGKLTTISSKLSTAADFRSFCQELLKTLTAETESQIGAVYLLDEQKKKFLPYESIGASQSSLHSFLNSASEGELGIAIATRSIQHITDIPNDVQVVFTSFSGDYRVKEIVTVPIVYGVDVVAILSLANIKNYTQPSLRLISGIYNEVSARIVSLINWQRILEISESLQRANSELEQQAKELEMQTSELTEQNFELEQQKKQLDEASRLKTNFLSNMSHELRTPLNSVIALTGVLRKRLTEKIPAEEFSYLEVIERNGKGLLALINDILDISRIESGREEIDIEPFSLSEAINDIIEMISPQAEQKDVELVLESTSDIRISSDMKKVRHILQNLIGNAVKFTERGKVSVSIRSENQTVSINVTDTGIGISQEELPYIFDEFRQADGSTSRRFGGAGLGLAISKKYADMLGGFIQVKSKLNIGSEFVLTLPIQMETSSLLPIARTMTRPEQKLHTSHTKVSKEFSQKIVLLIEDNEAATIQMQDLIGMIGCRILSATNAEEAFRLLSQTIPDAMILDLMMPGVDGFKVLETLRNAEITAHVPVLILTAKQITKDELHFLKRNNIHQLIQKGDVNIRELQDAITGMFLSTNEEKTKKSPKIDLSLQRKRATVLVVEDHPDNMITIRALLADKFEVLEAVDAHSCINIVTQCTPDLVLLDIALPDINGTEVFRQIRTIPRLNHTPVIALTASALRQDRETILAHGFDGFIAKPIEESEFYRVIDEVLYGK